MQKKKIHLLIIDDDQTEKRLFELYAMDVEGVDIECHFTPRFEDGVAQLQVKRPNLVFLDNRITPYDNYTQTVPRLREAGYDGPVVVMSASLFDEVFNYFRDYGVSQCIDKLDLSAAMLERVIEKYAV